MEWDGGIRVGAGMEAPAGSRRAPQSSDWWQRHSVMSPWFWTSGASEASQKVSWERPLCHGRVLDTSAGHLRVGECWSVF